MNCAAPVGHGGGGSVADRIQRIDHIGIAVSALEPAVSLFHDTLGGRFLSGGDNEQTGLRLLHLALPGLKVELLQPLRDDSLVSPFLTRRGAGFHHLTLFVDDVPTTVDTLGAAGFRTSGTDVRSQRWSETFLSPRSAFGTLLQFTSTTLRWDIPASAYTLGDVLAGRVVWRNYIACLRSDSQQQGEDSGD